MSGIQQFLISPQGTETIVIALGVLAAFFVVLSFCTLIAIVSISNSLSSIRNILQQHFTEKELSNTKQEEITGLKEKPDK